jgi:hypothetical protein
VAWIVEVEVLKLGRKDPQVLVQFVDASFEERQKWVPLARLKVRWGAVDEFRDSEARWDRIFELGRGSMIPLTVLPRKCSAR